MRQAIRLFLRIVFILTFLFIGFGFAGYVLAEYSKNLAGKNKNPVIMLVRPGDGDNSISWELYRKNIISNRAQFFIAKYSTLKPFIPKIGEYEIPAYSTLSQAMDILHSGVSLQHKITFPEGFTSKQIISLLNNAPHMRDQIVVIPQEGSLFPDTYFYTRDMSRHNILERASQKFEVTLAELWAKRKDNLPIKSSREAVILASIVEQETGKQAERPIIASVFINRLKSKMPLQSDPTVIYGLKTKGVVPKRLLRKHLKQMHDWNTYMFRGLPKTPISNPGFASIQSVLNPAKTDYLYFVADGLGGHRFAKTLDEHNDNVREYRKTIATKKE